MSCSVNVKHTCIKTGAGRGGVCACPEGPAGLFLSSCGK